MAARSIKEGDRVRICMNADSYMSGLANEGIWTVMYTPAELGVNWEFNRGNLIIEVNPLSANFDGLELVEEEEATDG